MEEKQIDELIIERCNNLSVVADASILLDAEDDSYAMLRHIGFGASDSSKLLGINPFTKLQELLDEKRNLEPANPAIKNKATVRKGKELEDLIMQKASKHLGIEIFKPKNMYKFGSTRLTVNFDGVTLIKDTLIPVEIKMCSSMGRKYYNFDKALSEDITDPHWTTALSELSKIKTRDSNCNFPIYYYTQLQQQMMFLNSPLGILAVLDDYTWTMRYFCVVADQIMWKEIQVAEIKHRWNLHPEEKILELVKQKGQA